MRTRASLSVLLLPILAVGCGALSGLGTSGGAGGARGAKSTVGVGGSTGSVVGTTGSGGAGGATGSGATGSATGTGGADVGPWTFTSCAWLNGGDSGDYTGEIAIAQGAAFTVTQQGSTLAVTYSDQYGMNDAFTFDQTTGTSAVLAPGGALVSSGPPGLCVLGPGDSGMFATQMTATSGTLDYTSGAVFVVLQGTVMLSGPPPPAPCTAAPAPASMWLVCGDGGGWAPVPPDGGAPVPPIPAGTYMCGSEVTTYYMGNGETDNASASGSGMLELSQTGATWVATYTGDTINGTFTLAFSAASATAAYAGPGQMVTTPCGVPLGIINPPPPGVATPVPLPVEAGVLEMDGTRLVLMFRGTMTSATVCPGAVKTGFITCSTQ